MSNYDIKYDVYVHEIKCIYKVSGIEVGGVYESRVTDSTN